MKVLIAWLTGGWIGWLTSLAGLAAIVGALWFGFHQWTDSLRQEGRDEVQAKWTADIKVREGLAQAAAEDKRVKEKQHEIDLAKERADRERDGVVVGTVLAATGSELDRLRRTNSTVTARLVQAITGDGARPGVDGPAIASGSVFDECAARRVEVANDAERLAIQVRGLQAWARSAVTLCGEPLPDAADRPP